jgi:arsenate reductase
MENDCMLTFICYSRCSTCRRAKAFLDEVGAEYSVRDIKTVNPTYDELKTWLPMTGLSVKRLFNTSGQMYKSLNLKDRLPNMSEDECIKLLATDGMLVKRPILIGKNHVLAGFKREEWEQSLMK